MPNLWFPRKSSRLSIENMRIRRGSRPQYLVPKTQKETVRTKMANQSKLVRREKRRSQGKLSLLARTSWIWTEIMKSISGSF
jgi:hypothetical protein